MNQSNSNEQKPDAAIIGTTGQSAPVSKQDAEGLLMIDVGTGQVLPDQHDRPDWAEGLIMAELTERHTFYLNRLGPKYADEHKFPEVYAFEDLSWVALNPEDATEVELSADEEFRMTVIGEVLGVSTEVTDDADADGKVKDALAEVDIGYDNTRTGAEMEAFEQSQAEGFGDAAKEAAAEG